jgi:hypothetical protein
MQQFPMFEKFRRVKLESMTQLSEVEIHFRHRHCNLADCPICFEKSFGEVVQFLAQRGLTILSQSEEDAKQFNSILVLERETECAQLLAG